MRIWYDTEFVERGHGHAVELLSIGMVREDGAELYRVLADASQIAQHYAQNHEWLRPNVWEYLPTAKVTTSLGDEAERIDVTHPDVAPRGHVAEEIRLFCTEGLAGRERAELWAYYGSYDHVCLSQLFGRMIDLPTGMPMYTLDLMQLMRHHGFSKRMLPEQGDDAHHALADAKWNKLAWEYVRNHA